VTLHFGVSPLHCASPVHRVSHRLSLHTRPAPHSALVMHSTHSNRGIAHFGRAAGQSVFFVHETHDLVVGSQIGDVAGQSVGALHPMQAPVAESQSGAWPWQLTAASPTHER
jgi:hypothetical protein